MKKIPLLACIIIVLSVFLFGALVQAAFSDIEGHKYQEAIEFIAERNVVDGYPDGTYQPYRALNRAELLTILIGHKYPNLPSRDCFTDVKAERWYAKYVCKGRELGIVSGYPDGSFKPSQDVNFVEALIMLQRAYNIPVNTSVSPWYKNSVDSASEMNIIPPDTSSFSQRYTRGQMADMITRLIKYDEGTLDGYLGLKKNLRHTFDTVKNGGRQTNNQPTRASILSVNNRVPNTCETLLENGNPRDKINIVFIPDDNVSFEKYKLFVEKIFTENANYPNFTNTSPFKENIGQFNFYSIWKDENYNCKSEGFDCDVKMRLLAELCPVTKRYDGITKVLSSSIPSIVGTFGSSDEVCENSNPVPKATWSLSTGEQVRVNYCPGQSTVTTFADIDAVVHEWGHMIGDLPHPERNTIMAYFPYNGDAFDEIEVNQLCTKIAEGSDISFEGCVGKTDFDIHHVYPDGNYNIYETTNEAFPYLTRRINDELETATIAVERDNVIVLVPKGYELLGKAHVEDLRRCRPLISNFLGIPYPKENILMKIYISDDGSNGGSASEGVLYKRSQENIDDDLQDIIDNSSEGFLYKSSETYCANTHELVHNFLGGTPLPLWANEGFAEYTQDIIMDGMKSKDRICEDNGFYGVDFASDLGDQPGLHPYADLYPFSVSTATYVTARCFTKKLIDTFGMNSFRAIMQQLEDFQLNERLWAELGGGSSDYMFVEHVLAEIIGDEIYPLLNKFGIEPEDYGG